MTTRFPETRAALARFRRAFRFVVAAVLLKWLFHVIPKGSVHVDTAVARLAKEIQKAI